MMEKFYHIAKNLRSEHVEEWKNNGGSIVGYTCSYVPDEIMHAAGILPFRMRGVGAEETTIGDTYFGPFICSLPKCMLQLAGQGGYDFLDGAIITPGCDSMRRLDECWRKAGDDIPGTLPPFFFHFGVPHKFADYTVKWFTDEINRFIEAMEKHFSVTVTEEKLNEAITLYNRSRKAIAEFEELRTSPRTPLTGADALAVVMASTAMPRAVYTEMLEELITELKKNEAPENDRIRLMLVGSASDDVELVRAIEGENAVVVADTLCFSSRFHHDLVDEDEEPLAALAHRYLGKNECPRMYGQYRQRLASIMKRAEEARVDGVILQNIRFCDLHGSENGLLERDLEKAGIPGMRLEREYGPMVETGRLKMRVDAFLARIQQGRASA